MRLLVLKRGMQPRDAVVGFFLSSEPPRDVAFLTAPLSLQTDPRYHPGPSRNRRDSIFDDDWSLFANISG